MTSSWKELQKLWDNREEIDARFDKLEKQLLYLQNIVEGLMNQIQLDNFYFSSCIDCRFVVVLATVRNVDWVSFKYHCFFSDSFASRNARTYELMVMRPRIFFRCFVLFFFFVFGLRISIGRMASEKLTWPL